MTITKTITGSAYTCNRREKEWLNDDKIIGYVTSKSLEAVTTIRTIQPWKIATKKTA